MSEIWIQIKNYPKYQISNLGRIKSGRGLLKPFINRAGYLAVSIYNENGRKYKWVHRLLGEHFVVGYEEGYVVDHKDGNPLNNSLSNLQWITQKENIRKGTAVKMSRLKNSKLYEITHPNGKVELIRNLTQYAKDHGITHQHLSRVAHGLRKHCRGLVIKRVEVSQ